MCKHSLLLINKSNTKGVLIFAGFAKALMRLCPNHVYKYTSERKVEPRNEILDLLLGFWGCCFFIFFLEGKTFLGSLLSEGKLYQTLPNNGIECVCLMK